MKNLLIAVVLGTVCALAPAGCGKKDDANKKCGEIHDRAFANPKTGFVGIGLIYAKNKDGFIKMCSRESGWRIYKHVHAECLAKSDKEMAKCVDEMVKKHRKL